MGKQELTKVEALKLIAPVVDDEATKEEHRAFMDFIANNADVRNKYESMKNLKSFIGSRSNRVKAPPSLQQFVKEVGNHSEATKDDDAPIYDLPTDGPAGPNSEISSGSSTSSQTTIRKTITGIAASLLLAATAWSYVVFWGSQPAEKSTYNIEQFAYEHFVKHNGKYVEPTIATASLGSAEIQMADNYDMPMTIPSLKNAEFKGILYSDFVPDFKAPMLEYHLPSQDQYIYIFAFKLDKLEEFGRLMRYKEAVDQCNKPKDFYIRNVNDKHVVSWKWNDVWYAAISNHDGNTLASLVEPLQFNPDNK